MNINKNIQIFLQQFDNLNDKKIAVGYSAGADSTVLLHVLAQKSHHFGFSLEAVFFSHNGSPINYGEDKNLILAKELCKNLNINLIEVELNLFKTAKKSWEQLGRNGRLDFYKKSNYDLIFLGHHQDDQNETTMMQILRGGGRGVGGMKPIDGKFCRPMLNIQKKDIYKYLTDKSIPWIEDPTNENIDFTRNFWRKVGLPTIEKYYPNYGQLLENFREKNNNLNQIALDMAKIDGLENLIKGNSISIKELPEYRVNNLLTYAFSLIGNSLEGNKIENFLKIGKATKESEILVGDYNLKFDGENLMLFNLKHDIKTRFKP